MSIENPNFLKKKYGLHKSPEVESAADRTEARSGEKMPQNPAERIQNYLDRFKEITERTDPAKRERGMQALKQVLHDRFIIKPEEIPEAYFENQRRLAREQGHGDIEITEEARDQLTEVIITDQQTTLDNWIDYLSSKDATYPDWLKYYAFRSVLGLSTFDKEKHEFGKRSKGTTAPFPDLNREALAYVLDVIEKKYEGKTTPLDTLEGEERQRFEKLLQGENFAKLYTWAIEKVTPASADQLMITEGQWMKYDQDSDHMPLVESLQGHGTGWCTAGESTAETQLKAGDFYVYYSFDQNNQPTIPRAAIRMEGERIAEVRGIAEEQNLDPYIGTVVQEKLGEFGQEGAAYQKKSADMRQLTTLDNKVKAGQELTKDELIFLYEIETPIEGFGYQRDPRIEELRSARNPHEDAPTVLECTPEQIAWSEAEINENTKAYVGPLFSGIFTKLAHLDHLYTKFPEGRIRKGSVEIGGMAKEDIEVILTQKNINLSSYARDLLHSPDFTVARQPEQIDLVRLTVHDLGFPSGATTEQIYAKADELGLDLCPAEVGPHLRLGEDTEKQFGEYFFVGMKQITDSDGRPHVFCLDRGGHGPWLGALDAKPTDRWNPDDAFVFRPRKEPSNP